MRLLLPLLFLFISLPSTQAITISGKVLPKELNNQYLYIGKFSNPSFVDSVLVTNQSFSITLEGFDPFGYYFNFRTPRCGGFVYFENNEDTIQLEITEISGRLLEIDIPDSALYSSLKKYTKEIILLTDTFVESYYAYDSIRANENAFKILLALDTLTEKNMVIATKTAYSIVHIDGDLFNYLGADHTKIMKKCHDFIQSKPNNFGLPLETVEYFKFWGENRFFDFGYPDTSGNIVRLSDFKKKYVLIDFWASWCGPCREKNKELKENLYKVKTENVDIVSISQEEYSAKSADKNYNKWLRAIKEDDLNWTQLQIYSQKDVSALMILYRALSIPTVYLLDQNRNILKRNPSLEEIIKIVNEE